MIKQIVSALFIVFGGYMFMKGIPEGATVVIVAIGVGYMK